MPLAASIARKFSTGVSARRASRRARHQLPGGSSWGGMEVFSCVARAMSVMH
jgi:hypothetical protein